MFLLGFTLKATENTEAAYLKAISMLAALNIITLCPFHPSVIQVEKKEG